MLCEALKDRKEQHSAMENTLISSTLMNLSPAERKRARHATYPIFKDNSNSRDMIEYSYLFDEIPFALQHKTKSWRKDLCGGYDVFYHDEKIDWGGSQGWDVPSTRQNHREGLLCIGRSETSSPHLLTGRLLFLPYDDDELCFALQNGISDEEDDDDDEESYSDGDGYDDGDDGSEERYDEQRSEHSESNSELLDGEESNSSNSHDEAWQERQELRQELYKRFSFFHFNEDTFVVLDEMYNNASWFDSGNELGRFGLISYVNPHRNEEEEEDDDDGRSGDSSLTIFRVNESMAFARGDKQDFISLENPPNHGVECGSNYDKYGYLETENSNDNVDHIGTLIERMQAYRGSWISKLRPSSSDMNISIPDGVEHLIWEYWQTGPPPYLFVNKGDLLLLARCEENIPDPELPEMLSLTVRREHLVLARTMQ